MKQSSSSILSKQQALMQHLSKISTIARPIDPTYPTNLAIIGLALVVLIGGTILRLFSGMALLPGVLAGVSMSLAVFLTWALAREIDPDHDLSAFAAAGLTLVGLIFFAPPALMAVFWMLVLLRIVNRTVGLPAKILDTLLILGLGISLTRQGNWGYGLITALALWLDSQLAPPHKRHLFFAGITLLVTAIFLVFNGLITAEGQLPSSVMMSAVTVSSLLFVPVIFASWKSNVTADLTGEPLNPRRIQAVQIVALLTGWQLILWNGYPGLVSLMPLWTTILGVALYGLLVVGYSKISSANR